MSANTPKIALTAEDIEVSDRVKVISYWTMEETPQLYSFVVVLKESAGSPQSGITLTALDLDGVLGCLTHLRSEMSLQKTLKARLDAAPKR